MKYDVIILGAGSVGVNSAYWLNKAGYKVAVIERQKEAAQETTFANGGQISVSHAEPWANPSAIKKVLGWLLKGDSPLLFRPRLDPYQWIWMAAWLRECLPARTDHNTVEIVKLATYSRDLIQQVRNTEKIDYDEKTKGILHFYRSEKDFAAAIPVADLMREHGCNRQIIERDQLFELEPAFKSGPAAEHIVGATYTAEDESGDARIFTQQLAERCKTQGVDFFYGYEVDGLQKSRLNQQVSHAYVTDLSDQRSYAIGAQHFVMSLGSYSPNILRPLGVFTNIYPAKGYSITIPVEPDSIAPEVSLTDDEYKIVYSRLGDRLRVAGTAELSGYSTDINPLRCQALIDNVKTVFPNAGDFEQVEVWSGLRPTTPSNLPYIGGTKYANLWLNTGHGTLGWTMGCGSGKLIADKIAGAVTDIEYSFA